MDGTTAVLRPRGEIIYGCVTVLDRALEELPGETDGLVLDMADVTFMDSAGLQFLEHLTDHSRLYGVPTRTVNWGGQPRRVLELTGLPADDRESEPGIPPPQSASADRRHRPGHSAADPAAHHSAVAAERAEQVRQLQEEVRQLRQAIVSRPVIDQARGILMAVESCSSDEAWHVLRDASQHANTKLRTVATAVVAGTTDGPAPSEPIRRALYDATTRQLTRRK
ncbi:ANTAR domain-containing protein [Streptomyces sp. NPDC050704]|uniref:ANTAR domain-containing protein n=1 Tax=Streptomyces sp. NPDC050704 TaxID=3157219 RepID=UPI003439E174